MKQFVLKTIILSTDNYLKIIQNYVVKILRSPKFIR
jgi:hypothetical protein